MDRKRLGLLGIVTLAINQLVGAWDWWSRTHGLDPYLGAKADTFWGHFLVAALSPIWLIVVAVFFGVLWAIQPRLPKHSEQRSPGVVAATNSDISAALAACQQSLKEEAGRNLALVADNKKLQRDSEMMTTLKPLIRMYRATHSLLGELVVFMNDMEEIKPSGDSRADYERIQRVGKMNSEKYHKEFRYRVISLATDLKTQYGLLHPGLTDDALVRDVFGPLGVKPIIEGLAHVFEELRKMLADAAGNLNV